MIKSSYAMTAAVAVLAGTQMATAGSIEVLLDQAHQGKGNKGAEFRPLDINGDLAAVLITARSSIDRDDPFTFSATGFPGTVYIEKDQKGAGTQASDGGGSSGISGGGGDQNEELIFTFDMAADAFAIEVGLYDFDPGDGLDDGDDTAIYIDLAGSSETLMFLEADFAAAVTDLGNDRSLVDFGLLGLAPGSLIDRFAVRETNGHIFVNFLNFAEGAGPTPVPVPAPLALGLAGLLGAGIWKRRRV